MQPMARAGKGGQRGGGHKINRTSVALPAVHVEAPCRRAGNVALSANYLLCRRFFHSWAPTLRAAEVGGGVGTDCSNFVAAPAMAAPYARPSPRPPRTGRDPEESTRTLFIRNLSFEASEAELHKMFEQYGELKRFFNLITKRGIIFVTFVCFAALCAYLW